MLKRLNGYIAKSMKKWLISEMWQGRKKDESRPTVEGDGSTVEFLGYDILLKDGKSSVNVTNNYKLIEIIVYDGV